MVVVGLMVMMVVAMVHNGGYDCDCDDDQDEIEVLNNEEESECIEDFCLESGYRSWQYSKQNNR